MGKRYFCEYCNRSFQDNLTARKQHLNGSVHMRNRQAWYQNFKGEYDLGCCCIRSTSSQFKNIF